MRPRICTICRGKGITCKHMCDTCAGSGLIKFCPNCEKSYPATPAYFMKNAANLDGFQTYCRECINERPHRKEEIVRFKIKAQKAQSEAHQALTAYRAARGEAAGK